MSDDQVNAADPEQVQSRKQKAKKQGEQQRDDLHRLLEMPEFRRYLWRHINETCGLTNVAAHPNGSQQSINIGMQSVGKALWMEVEGIDPLYIPRMMVEHFEALKA